MRTGPWSARARCGAVLVAWFCSGCVYHVKSLPDEPAAGKQSAGPSAYPGSPEEEERRRCDRRRWALVAAPAEILAGVGLTVAGLALRDEPLPDDGGGVTWWDDVSSSFGDSFFVAAMLGTGLLMTASGVGDLVQGATDHLLRSPFVACRADGACEMVPRERLADGSVAPQSAPQLDSAFGFQLSTRGGEWDLGLGLFHWVSRQVRLRYGVAVGVGAPAFETRPEGADFELYYEASIPLSLDWNPAGRRAYGRYPGHAVTLYASPIFARDFDGGAQHVGWRAGAGWSVRGTSLLLGVTQLVGRDELPRPELRFVWSIPSN